MPNSTEMNAAEWSSAGFSTRHTLRTLWMDGASVQPPCRGKACGLDPSVTRRTTAAAASVLVITAHPHRTIEANDQHARPLCKDEQHTRSGDVSIPPDHRATAFA
jgi:hypothetical protein